MNEREITSMPWVQEWPSKEGDESWARKLDENLERRQPTRVEKERMDRELIALGNLFKDSDMWWQIDGSLNISLQREQYIGVHWDIDISVQRKDISQLEELLAAKGYGLFFFQKNLDERGTQQYRIRRVGAEGFQKKGDWRYHIQAIDEEGKTRSTDDLTWIDVHVVERNEIGEPYYDDHSDTRIPEHWLDTKNILFHDVPLRLSNPARFIFFKMFRKRKYDEADLKTYIETGVVTMQDIEEVEQVMQNVFVNFEKQKVSAQQVIREILTLFENNNDRNELTKSIRNLPLLHSYVLSFTYRAKDSEWLKAQVQQFTDRILDLTNPTFDSVLSILLKPMNIDVLAVENQLRERLVKIRQWMQDGETRQT